MRKIYLVFSLLIFFFSFNISNAKLWTVSVFAQSDPQQKVDYELPYPGLLPNSPLYVAKTVRDAIVDFLISDPLKKADFYLLQGDKRLNAGVYLFKMGKSKYNLAESTMSKGEDYFEKAIAKTREAKGQGTDIADISRRLLDAAKKHQEVLGDLERNADSKIKASLRLLLKRSAGFGREVQSLILKR